MGKLWRGFTGWASQRKLLLTSLLLITLGIGMVVGTLVSDRAAASRATPVGAALLTVPDPVRLSSGFASIVSQIEPAVVNISTTQYLQRPRQRGRRMPSPFGDFFFDGPDEGPETEQSLGSGVIVDPAGFILTNKHVIDGASRIQVTLNGDPNRYAARVIGTDDETDLAVIKINAGHPLPIVRMGNSDGVQVGEWVLAFGSPFGLQSSVTAGIISAKNRSSVSRKQFQRFLQTDAPINPGNSGGPLVNMAGQVIGINTAIYTGSHGFEGVGFALPSNTASQVYNQIVTHGRVIRGSIGISFNEEHSSNPVTLRELGASYGVIVEGVRPGSPAARAGLRPGDVIIGVDGRPVRAGSDLVDPIAQAPIGSRVRVEYLRDGRRYQVQVEVADREKIFPYLAAPAGQDRGNESEPSEPRLGLAVQEILPEQAARLGLSSPEGVIVRDVQPGSFADDIGLDRGDVIVEINRVPIHSLTDYRRELSRVRPGQDVLFKVLRRADDQMLTVFLAGQMPEEK
jgi:serine protease Do